MENKYFVPSIEELHVGYEHEYRNAASMKEYWVKGVIFPHLLSRIATYNKEWFENNIRVPFLSKKQIEKEGWETKVFMEGEQHETFLFKKGQFECRWWGGPDYIEFHNTRTKDDLVYEGSCKCINTFRTICKLLNIN